MNFNVSFQKKVARMPGWGGVTPASRSRLLEDVVKSGKDF